MSQGQAQSQLVAGLLRHLGHPLKLRLALCTSMLGLWYSLYFSPINELVTATSSEVQAERKRVAVARDIERLKKKLMPYREMSGTGDVHDLMNHVMDRIRSSPLRLVDLKPEKPKDLGPYEAIGLRLSLEGSFSELDDFLGWIENEKRFLRFDAIRLTPDTRQAGRLSAQFTLLTLVEKAAPAPKATNKAGKKA